MRFLLQLGLVLIMITSFLVSGMTLSYEQSSKTYHCTASQPCDYLVCGDHICAPGEFAQLKATISQAQRGNQTSSVPMNMTGGNMTSGNMTTSQSTGTVIGGKMTYEDVASDGTIVIVRSAHPISGQPLNLGIGFFGANRNAIPNQNYAITITQDNSTVLSKSNGYASSGIDLLTTFPLSSSDPINLQVTLNGIGPSTADPSTWTGVKGETLTFSQGPEDLPGTDLTTQTSTATNTVPEFGTAASIVLAIAVLSIIVFVAKTRTIPRI